MLQLFSFDHECSAYHHAGLDFRLTDVAGKVVNDVIA